MVFHLIPKVEGSIPTVKGAEQLKKDIESVSIVKEKGKLYTLDFLSDYCFVIEQHRGNRYLLIPLPKACGYSRSTHMPMVYGEVVEDKNTSGSEFKYVIKTETWWIILSFVIGGLFLGVVFFMLLMFMLGMGGKAFIGIIFCVLFGVSWLFGSFWVPCNRTLKMLDKIVTHDPEQDRRVQEQLETQMREYEKSMGIDSDGFVN